MPAPQDAPQRAQTATQQMMLGDYRTVSGIKLPHLITRAVNDMTIEEWKVDSYRVNPSFKADVFTKWFASWSFSVCWRSCCRPLRWRRRIRPLNFV